MENSSAHMTSGVNGLHSHSGDGDLKVTKKKNGPLLENGIDLSQNQGHFIKEDMQLKLDCISLSDKSSSYESMSQQIINLKASVKQLFEENRALKERDSKMKLSLKESQREIGELEKVNTVYKNRLNQFGHSTEVFFEDGDTFVPEVSRDLLMNLAKENVSLKDQMKYSQFDTKQVDAMAKKIQDLEKYVEELKKELDKQKYKSHQLHCILEGSRDVKDREIFRLQGELDSIHQSSLTQDVLCQSLSEESNNLKRQLKTVSSQCQELAKKLEQKNDHKHKSQPHGLLQSADGKEADLKMKLETKLHQVVEMNTKWQEYNNQRETYVQKLQQDLAKLQEESRRMSTSSSKGMMSEKQQQDVDRVLLSSKKKLDNLEDENMSLESENRRLKHELEEAHNQNRDLSRQLDVSKRSKSSQEDKDRIQVLQAQVEILSEDFRLERSDREAAQTRIAELEDEMQRVYRQYNGGMAEGRMDHATKRAVALQRYQDDYYRQQRRLTERGHNNMYYDDVVVDGPEDDGQHQIANQITQNHGDLDLHADYGYDEIDGGFDETDAINKADMLQCPRCQKEFSPEKHNELLEHVDICCD